MGLLAKLLCFFSFFYIWFVFYQMYSIYYPSLCSEGEVCLDSFLKQDPSMQLLVYTSSRKDVSRSREKFLSQILSYNFSKFDETITRELNVSIPNVTRRNGSLWAHAYLLPQGESPFSNSWVSYTRASLTEFKVRDVSLVNLIGGTGDASNESVSNESITHWWGRLHLCAMTERIRLHRFKLLPDVAAVLSLSPEGEFLPPLYMEELGRKRSDLLPLETSVRTLPLKLTYEPVTLGKLRLHLHLYQSLGMLPSLGMSSEDVDQVKSFFTGTNLYLLLLTVFVSVVHLLFDILAFKNDVSYWKERESMEGLSRKGVVWRAISTFVIFLYLQDEHASLLIRVPAGVGAVIEFWKVKKAAKLSIDWGGRKIVWGKYSQEEKLTQEYEGEAMHYLQWLFYPLCLAGAIYSLLYTAHRGWYSWLLQSLVNGVYAFGFLFMLPQLFINYRMKSVAHLPWRAFAYKAFNTFIDDVFAFIISMPTAHRLACFRDDIVFFVYLYQRWLYPVDMRRVNEYGQTFIATSEDSSLCNNLESKKNE